MLEKSTPKNTVQQSTQVRLFFVRSAIHLIDSKIEVIMNTMVSLVAEIPDSLHQELQQFLNQESDWDFDQLLTVAISSFLYQNSIDLKKKK